MLKRIFLIGAVAMSFPALAQITPQASDDLMTPPTTGEATAESVPSGAAPTPAPIAQIVEQEFPAYDVSATGELSEAEFAAWMIKLRTASDSSVDPDSAEVKTWIGQAFAEADADKSGGVNKTELIGFLSRGA